MPEKEIRPITQNQMPSESATAERNDSTAHADPLPLDPFQPDPRQIIERVDLRVLRALRRIIHCVHLYSHELSSKTRMTAPQLVCLITLAERGAMTATTISREVFLSPSTVVGILDRLEEKGLVRRERVSKDRRIVTVTISDKGRVVAETAPSPLQSRLTEALGALPGADQIAIAESLERVVNLMEAQDIDAAPVLTTGSIVKTDKDDD